MSTLKERDKYLLVVSVSEKTVVGNLRFGAHLERKFGTSIDEIVLSVSADRYRLAVQFLTSARVASKSRPPQYRSAISRAYYAMYHSARAIVYVVNAGDDYQDHVKLSQQIPEQFPAATTWRNRLREARLLRNRCDYDPYPKQQKFFAADSADLLVETQEFLRLSKRYLVGRGCKL